jgi:hypothetical protein
MRIYLLLILSLLSLAATPSTQPTTQPVGNLPHIQIDVKNKQLRIDCYTVAADYPLEFLAVMTNTNEYEAIVRSDARPSDLHLALLMLGLTPGHPLQYSQSEDKWYPPTGPLIRIYFEYQEAGKTIRIPAYQWMRDITTKQPPTTFDWCFTGSRFLDTGEYGPNATGQLISVVNNDLSVLDVPALKSRAMDSRQWERNTPAMPPMNTPVTMILTPAPDQNAPTTQP